MQDAVKLGTFILIIWGITCTVTFGSIFKPIRDIAARIKYTRNNLGYMLHCPMCFGFWAGLGVSYWSQLGPVGPIPDAFISAGTCYLLRAVFVYACEDCAMNLPAFNETAPPEPVPVAPKVMDTEIPVFGDKPVDAPKPPAQLYHNGIPVFGDKPHDPIEDEDGIVKG